VKKRITATRGESKGHFLEVSQSELADNSNQDEKDYPAAQQRVSLVRAQKLLLAALRVWELKYAE
jgi:hypothetical protein